MNSITPEKTQWDDFVKQHPRAHFLQLSAWGDLKSAYGWSCDRVALVEDGDIVAGAQLLFKPLPTGVLGTMAYLPYGGYVTDDSQWGALWDAVEQCAKSHGAVFLKWEAGFFLNKEAPDFTQWGFVESPQTVQPPRTVMLNIAQEDDDIQSPMNQSTRRNIRKAYKNDVHYYEASPEDVSKFTRIMEITGDRNEFGVHEPEYYQMMYDLLVPEYGALILAEHEGDTLAANFVLAVGDTAAYLAGASASKKRKLMASYGVQWEAIQWAKQRGYTYYDMWGVPDEDAETLEDQFQERSDGLWGVYRFKRGWGGDVVRSAGTWDKVYNRLVYQAYKMALKVRG